MTKESERKKIVEAIVSEGEVREHLKAAGFEFKEMVDESLDEAEDEAKSKKKKANI